MDGDRSSGHLRQDHHRRRPHIADDALSNSPAISAAIQLDLTAGPRAGRTPHRRPARALGDAAQHPERPVHARSSRRRSQRAGVRPCFPAVPTSSLLFGRVAPPRPRSVTPVSDSTRCTKPYERPVDSARARMLAPFSYFFFGSVASFSRCAPVMRAPFFRSATVAVPSRSLNCLVRADEGPGAAMIVHRWGGDQESFSKIGERFRRMDHTPRWSLPPIDHRPVTAGDSGTPGGRRRSASPRRSAPRPTTRPAAVSARAVQRPRPGPPPPDRRAHRPPGAGGMPVDAEQVGGGYDGDQGLASAAAVGQRPFRSSRPGRRACRWPCSQPS